MKPAILAHVLALTALPQAAPDAAAQNAQVRRGQALADDLCGPCHATGREGLSPHVAAPPFRMLNRFLEIDTLRERLRDGLATTHRDMPLFRFSRDDARALVVYLRAIQAP